ncbi:MAG: FAD-dependent oxidoreductase [Acidobacteriota bacterium]
MRNIVILGNGIAGITAARHLRKRCDDEILVISGESDHFFSRTALMYIYMGHMAYENTKPYEDHFWDDNRIQLLRAWVTGVDFAAKTLTLQGGRTVRYDVLILATGSKPNKFGWPGQDLHGVQGLYSLQDLEQMETSTRRGVDRAVVVGGGLIGIEMTEMFHSRGIPVTFLVREKTWMQRVYPREESEMINREIRDHGIDLRLATELERVEGDDRGWVRSVVTTDGEEIPCQFLGLTVGVSPNIEFLRTTDLETDRGILVDGHLRTNQEGVYAIGDCAQVRDPVPGRRPVEPLWYTGRMMGETVARVITGEDLPYDPGIWFNSAKFFELEWQVYGNVGATPADGEETLFWRDPGGKKAIRINYRTGDRTVTGFQVMGIRYRHELCHQWLEEGADVRTVLENLGAANFDPEFYAQHEKDLISIYNQKHPDAPLRLKRRRGLKGFFQLRRAS